jgi:hypothetical protein
MKKKSRLERPNDEFGLCPVCYKITGFYTQGEYLHGFCAAHRAHWFLTTSTSNTDLRKRFGGFMQLSKAKADELRHWTSVEPFFWPSSPPSPPKPTERIVQFLSFMPPALAGMLSWAGNLLRPDSPSAGELYGLCPVCHQPPSRGFDDYGCVTLVCEEHQVCWCVSICSPRPVPKELFARKWRQFAEQAAILSVCPEVEEIVPPAPASSPDQTKPVIERYYWCARRNLRACLKIPWQVVSIRIRTPARNIFATK